MRIERELDYNDVLILPQPSKINHRGDVNLSTWMGDDFILDIPIMAAPMKGIVGPQLINELSRQGGLGFLHRFYNDPIVRSYDLEDISNETTWGASVSIDSPTYMDYLEAGARIICVDVANGYIDSVITRCEEVASYISSHGHKAWVMGGCVVTPKGCDRLYDAGCKFIRVGIGSGALCSTRNATGIGRPQISAILECSQTDKDYYVVADGGIRNSGDAAKALGAGADFVMMGSWFAQAFESERVNGNNTIYGMASAEHQISMSGATKSVEGIKREAQKVASLKPLLDEFVWNLKSAFTYVGASNITEFHSLCKFVEVSSHVIKRLDD